MTDKIYNYITIIVWAALLLIALTGCSTTRPTVVERHTTDTLKMVQHHRDSIYVHDSIMVAHWGDTVRVDRWHTLYRDRWHTDTLYRNRTDSVPYPVEVIKEVPAPLSTWQQVRMSIGSWAVILTAFFILYKLVRARMRI